MRILDLMKIRLAAFKFAWQGIVHGFRQEANFRFHSLAAVLVVGLGMWLRITTIEWCIVILCIGMVMAVELLNAAVERLADRITKEEDPLIGQAKDLGAGAVLITAYCAFVIGLLIFLPHLWLLFS